MSTQYVTKKCLKCSRTIFKVIFNTVHYDLTFVAVTFLIQCTRAIQKISSVCEYCCCSAAVTMVRKRAKFLDSLLRHGRNLQTSEQCLRIVLCVYTWSVRKVSDRIFLCEHLMDYNLARLHEPTLNFSAHA